MTVFFNFFEKSATKHQIVYRYGVRKGNLTFFQNYSLNRGYHSLYEVKVEKIFKITPQIRYYWTVLCGNKKKLSLFCIQKYCLCRVLEQERRNYILFLDFVFKQALAVEC